MNGQVGRGAASGPPEAGRPLRRDFGWALAFVLPYWRSLALVLALSLVSTLLALFIPYLSKLLVDGALLGRDASVLLRTLLAFGALTLGSFALNVLSGLRYTRVSAEILFDMRRALFERLQRLSPRFYADVPSDRSSRGSTGTSARFNASSPKSRSRGWGTCSFWSARR